MSLFLQWGLKSINIDKRLKNLVGVDLAAVQPQLTELWNAEMQRQFETEGRADPRMPRWRDLAPRTQRERVRLGYGANSPKLVRTGLLRQAVLNSKMSIVNKRQPLFRFRVDTRNKRNGLSMGQLATIHHRGHYRFIRVPARPFYLITPRFKKLAGQIVSRYIREQRKKKSIRKDA